MSTNLDLLCQQSLDELANRRLASVDAIVTFAEDVSFEGQNELHRGPPLVNLAAPGSIEWSVKVLPKEDSTITVVDVQYDTAGCVTWRVQVAEGFAADGHGSCIAGEGNVNVAWLQWHVISLRGGRDGVSPSDGGQSRLMRSDFAVEPGTKSGSTADVVDVFMGEHEEDCVLWLQSELTDVAKDAVDAAARARVDEDKGSSEIDQIDVAVADAARRGPAHGIGIASDANGGVFHGRLPQDAVSSRDGM